MTGLGDIRLYEAIGRMRETADQLQAERDQLKAENVKLQELVKAMTPFLCCMPFASCNTLAASVRKRMSELGIEVEQ